MLSEGVRVATPPKDTARQVENLSCTDSPLPDPFAGIEDDSAGADKYIPIFIDDAGCRSTGLRRPCLPSTDEAIERV